MPNSLRIPENDQPVEPHETSGEGYGRMRFTMAAPVGSTLTPIVSSLVCVVLYAAVATAPCLAQSRQGTARQGSTERPSLTTSAIAELALPATVFVSGDRVGGQGRIHGSGFVVDHSGTIVTNLHVIGRLANISVQLHNGDIYERVKVRATDEQKDVAILQIPGFNVPTLTLGDSDTVRVGDPVVLVGSPLGLDGTVTAGIVSSLRPLPGYRVIQTDAAASPGNSGGPMLNARGEVVGVLTFGIKRGENLNFVVPINYVRGLLAVDDNLTLAAVVQRYSAANRQEADADDGDGVGSTPAVPTESSAPPTGATGSVGTSVLGPVHGSASTHALIYVYRSQRFNMMDPPVTVDGIELVRMDTRRYFSFWVAPGHHTLDAGGGSTASCMQPVSGRFDAGMVYFVRVDLSAGGQYGQGCFTLNSVDPEAARSDIKPLSPLNQSNARHPWVRLK